tara:strand:+ start:31 stop:213 length:183 start_codon:yes stop_codon:yes gene_type:complete
MIELIDFQNSKWVVKTKIEGHRVEDHTKLKEIYGCDLVLKNAQDVYFILQKVIDVEFEDV